MLCHSSCGEVGWFPQSIFVVFFVTEEKSGVDFTVDFAEIMIPINVGIIIAVGGVSSVLIKETSFSFLSG